MLEQQNQLETNIFKMDRGQDVALKTNDLHVWYGQNEAIKGVSLEFEKIKLLH